MRDLESKPKAISADKVHSAWNRALLAAHRVIHDWPAAAEVATRALGEVVDTPAGADSLPELESESTKRAVRSAAGGSSELPPAASIHELDTVALTHPVPSHGLEAGDVGAVVHVYEGGRAFEVEFVSAGGRTLAVITLTAGEIRPLGGEDILHARNLAGAGPGTG
jgi:hypothetical protein